MKIPKYLKRNDRDKGFAEHRGVRTYFPGRYDSPESREAYGRWCQRLLSQSRSHTPAPRPGGYTVAELVLAYLDYAVTYYVRDGRPTSEYHLLRSAFAPLLSAHGSTPADTFGPLDLEAARERMVAAGWKRRTINAAAGRVRRMFRWAVRRGLIAAETWMALAALEPLKRGRTPASEPSRGGVVDEAHVDATLPHLPRIVADMVRLQRITGMRSEALCLLRPCDVDRSSDVWIYRPTAHKGDWRAGESLVIALGPRAQAVLAPYMQRAADTYCFSPRESEAERSSKRRADRESPMTPSQAAREPAPRRSRAPRGRYGSGSYRRAIQRTIERVNAERAKDGQAAIPRWHPHQLRHAVATTVRRQFGLEAAQVALGHSRADVTEIYAARNLVLAQQVAREIG